MKVLVVIMGLDPISGGPTRSCKGMCRALSQAGVEVSLWVLHGHHPFENPCGVKVRYADDHQLSGLLSSICQYDLVHLQGLWDLGLHAVAKLCRKEGVPYVISPHGMLDPWALTVKKWKKRVAMLIYQRCDLKYASAFHVMASLEERSVRAQGLKQPIFIAPNGVDIPDAMPPRTNGGKNKTAIFVSRLHPGKGLLTLAEAWARVKPQGWEMKVVGPDSYGHKAEVLAKLGELGIRDQWQFVDMLDDEEKWVAYRGADLLIHPSVSENFGITIAEGLAAGLPAIATRGTPWQDLDTYGCGWWIGLGVDSLISALKQATSMSQDRLEDMGALGCKLVSLKYTWPAIGKRMRENYKGILSMKTKFDLVEKWQAGCIERLKVLANAGFRFSKAEDLQKAIDGEIVLTRQLKNRLAIKYYALKGRLPVPVPRVVHECQNVNCPDRLKPGFEKLKEELRQGLDLLPRMSRQVKDFDCCDGMLSDWGIQHFHLGVTRDSKHPDMIQGNDEIAYVFMASRDAYIITIDQHGRWADQELLEILLASYPSVLDAWETDAKDISYELNPAERMRIRKGHLNALIKLKNGKVYLNPGGGEATDGTPFAATMTFNRAHQFLRGVTDCVYEAVVRMGIWSEADLIKSKLVGFQTGNMWQVSLLDESHGQSIMIEPNSVIQVFQRKV